ncbi:hypothetical protein CAL26_01635 [Bordetella genomosp. 9]|uniref:Amidase domain-containing protein n=2 Tax=Bordetella genomosp. 9 TaxID=1416803 RepID=A0A261RP96_9BORD|nr:hypothetical protein CAL26_01635 [Bordetella genomosp. 9]
MSIDSTQPLHDLPLTELARRLRVRELDARDLADHFIDRIRAHPDPAVFIAVTADLAREQAERSAARWRAGKPAGAWDGVPLAWKDNIDVAGTATTAGSALRRDEPPAQRDAIVAAHAHAAGMVTLGKTNLSEFAYTALGLNPHYGTPRNPRAMDQPRAPGGSSSGSAVAVAAGLAPAAIGTDTGGSVRTPAAFNGLVGFKPAPGRYDMGGVFPLSASLDTVGFFVRHAVDCQGMDAMLRGAAIEATPVAADDALSGLTMLVPDDAALGELEPAVAASFEHAIERLRDAGARISRRQIPELDAARALVERHGALASAEAYAAHRAVLDSPRHTAMDPFVARRILAGKSMSEADVDALQRGRAALARTLAASLGEDTLLVMPTVPHVAPPLKDLQADLASFTAINLRTIRNTSVGNLLDLCGLTLPGEPGAAGMPTGIMFHAAAGGESALLARARALEAALK